MAPSVSAATFEVLECVSELTEGHLPRLGGRIVPAGPTAAARPGLNPRAHNGVRHHCKERDMGLLDSILGGLAGGAGGGMRSRRGGGLQATAAAGADRDADAPRHAGRRLGGQAGARRRRPGRRARRHPGRRRRPRAARRAVPPAGGGGGLGGLGTLGGLGALAGLAILASRLKQGGLGDAVGSWIGGGPNQQVSGQQLRARSAPTWSTSWRASSGCRPTR